MSEVSVLDLILNAVREAEAEGLEIGHEEYVIVDPAAQLYKIATDSYGESNLFAAEFFLLALGVPREAYFTATFLLELKEHFAPAIGADVDEFDKLLQGNPDD